jgi:dTDP-4-amino-4,6-dideoxygalactose transaminase
MSGLVSKELSSIFPGSSVCEFSRGSAGLHRLFEVVRDLRGPGEVIVPAICCETVALAARYAGHHVRFADIDSERFCATTESIAAEMSLLTRAVVLVHIFGLQCDIDAFNAIRKSNPDVVFIEDVAHAAGGCDPSGNELGGGLDHAMFSFSESKVLRGSGGAIVNHHDGEISRMLIAKRPDFGNNQNESILSLSLRNLSHAIADLHRGGSEDAERDFAPALWDRYQPVVVQAGPFKNAHAAVMDLRERVVIRNRRRSRAEKYRQAINHKGFRVATFSPNETCWRLPVMAETPTLARRATEALRAKGLHASNHYFPLHRLFGGKQLPNAGYVGDRILNLWVDETTNESQISMTAETINSL